MKQPLQLKLCFVLALSVLAGADEPAARPTRTLARIFGLESATPAGAPPAAPQPRLPLIYSVKYYDRTAEPKNEAPPLQQVGNPTRVLLNVYTGEQTPVYVDAKGQLLIPCPVYDHLYIQEPALGGRKPALPRPAAVQQEALGQAQSVPTQQLAPQVLYYAPPPVLQQKPVYDYPFVYGYPFSPPSLSPYVVRTGGQGYGPPGQGFVGQTVLGAGTAEQEPDKKNDKPAGHA